MSSRPLVVFGILGTSLDAGKGPARWEKWRPTVSLCQHEDLLVSRLVLLAEPRFGDLATQIEEDVRHASPDTIVERIAVTWKDAWDFEEVYAGLHDIARAYPWKPEREDYLIHLTTGTHVAQICLFLLTEARYFPGRVIQTSPPRKETRGGPGAYTIVDLDLSRYDRIASRFSRERHEGQSFLKAGIDTKNASFNRLIERVEEVAKASRAPMLLMGPTGAGKSQLAARIYELKKARRQIQGEFVPVNCATLRGDAAMATLFGHKKGAYTGAVADRPGLLRKADGGLLFLDEIGELGLDEQAMLLRAIEQKAFYPVGADQEVKSDFLLIAGTNRDLGARAARGDFREDLYARINLWTFRLPALRERPEDIEPNLDYELELASRLLGVNVTMNRAAREAFLDFAASPRALWSGNFRDLNACVTRMATLAHGGRITKENVAEEIERLELAWASGRIHLQHGSSAGGGEILAEVLGAEASTKLDRFDRAQLEEVLRVCRASRTLSEAGRTLFAESRKERTTVNDADRLRKYLARFGLDWQTASGRST
ncbi:RNA repair transcriptional activator RtcR [Polyangium sorediatum]|uniref:RNA repair transcriptional activator RtcR n=1 Tax=Polyangium sorediatum TaxID=889274 RepID=A0ABT6NIB1_9BACT|nr:RNA repair transcriptional activator RtcR [Polyangium sorediatum]MDI1428039.1 RNA repair transcriptional activator RtcR [Polyangium sorediatum]